MATFKTKVIAAVVAAALTTQAVAAPCALRLIEALPGQGALVVTNPEVVEVTANIVIHTAEGEEQRTLTIPASGIETLPFNVEDETVFEIGGSTPLEAFVAGKTAGGAMSYSNTGLCDDDGAEAGMAKPMVAPAVAAVIARVLIYVGKKFAGWVAKEGMKYAVKKALDYAKSQGLVHCPSGKNVTSWQAMKAKLLQCTY